MFSLSRGSKIFCRIDFPPPPPQTKILDRTLPAYFITVSFITLGNRIFNPPKRSLHFKSSLRLTENILKVPSSWDQQILENRLSQKNSHSSFKALHYTRKFVKSSVPLLHKGKIAWSVSLSHGIPPCNP